MAKYYKILFLFLSFSALAYPQQQNIQFTHLTTKDGLSSNRVNAIIKDSRGFMWFATNNGLNRYDGYNFKIYKYDPQDYNSISGNYITSLCEDRYGNIWIGTRTNGFNQFDRKKNKFSRYKFDTQSYAPKAVNSVSLIYEDSSDSTHVLLISTAVSFLKYFHKPEFKVEGTAWLKYFFADSIENELLDSTIYKGHWRIKNNPDIFRYYSMKPDNPQSMSQKPWKNIISDSNGNLWFGTPIGLNKLDKKTEIFTSYLNDPENPNSLSNEIVLGIYMDKEDILWIGTEGGGLDRFDTKTGRFRNFKHDPNNPYSIGSNYIHDVYGDPKGNLWIVTGGNGFYKFETNTERFICFKKASSKYSRIGIAYWGATYLDDSGKHWIGTANDGIYMYDPKKQNISTTVLYSDIDQTADVRAFYKDKKGKLWVSSTEGLFKFDQDRKTYTFNRYDRHHRNKLLQHSITSFVEDKRGFLWLGTEEGGLKRYNLRSGRIVEFLFNHENLFLTHPHWINLILKLKEDKKGNILIGNYVGDLIVFNKRTHKHKITIYQGSSFLVDHFKNLWRGYWGEGIKLYKDTSEETFHFFHTATDSTSLSSSYVMTIYEDNHNNIWIGTNNGLNLFNRETETFKDYTINDGLASDHILSILEDGHGSLWLCTPKGISRFNYLQKDYSGRPLIKNYQASDQVQFYADEIGYKDNEGFMYFGGRNGFVSFHPDSITENLHLPPIVLTDFKILNESPGVDSVGHSPLKSDISETQEINLSYDQNFFSFEFAALDYTDPMHNQYAYKMEGIDRDWTYTDVSHRHANYTDLDPGEYIFHVKGSNNEGLWNEKGKSIKIIINPPIWRTTWAYLLYFVALSAVLYAFRQYDLKRQRLKHELDLEHEHAEKLQEIDHIKSRFFANISHEFRTPLTLILGPIQSLIKKTDDVTTRNELSLMQRSALRLERLINQLLDLSKLEAGGMTIQLKEENIVDLVRNYAQSFESLAIQKDIKFIFKSDAENIPAFVDKNKIENILHNLLSNAFKFTPEGGKIFIKISTSEAFPGKILNNADIINQNASPQPSDFVEIKISDTGIGMPPDRLDKIFDRFYQIDGSHTREHEGTGIGLALTKELVELHYGTIKVKSGPNKGTTFIVKLPVGKEHFRDVQEEEEQISSPLEKQDNGMFLNEDTSESVKSIEEHLPQSPFDREEAVRSPVSGLSAPILLIVEDNADMCTYIRGHLSSEFQIDEAKDGAEGLQKALSIIPDLVISDIMMPVMDGYQLCEKLKTDQRTSHIPVILLTARAAKEDKLEGLETGADDYINKPFDADELKVRIKNLIAQRKLLKERFSSEALFPASEIAVTSTDKKFMDKAMKIIEQNLDNPDFTINILSDQIGMSREHFSRKVKALTNQPPHMFIRLMRLKRAAVLLKHHTGNVTEVAYDVGFKNLSHFAKSFREQFGITPSHFSDHN